MAYHNAPMAALSAQHNAPSHIQIHCFVIADSRFRDFESFFPINQHIYNTVYIVKRGARIINLEEAVLKELRKIPKSDIVIAYICAGINNLTYKYYHSGGYEIVPHNRQSVYLDILGLKQKIRRVFPRSIVGIATIPIVNFAKAQKYAKDNHHLVSKFTLADIKQMQTQLSDTLADINTELIHQNRGFQQVPGVGWMKPCQLYLHQEIEKLVYRKKQQERIVIKRIPDKVLTDGVHPAEYISLHWYNTIHNCFAQIVHNLRT